VVSAESDKTYARRHGAAVIARVIAAVVALPVVVLTLGIGRPPAARIAISTSAADLRPRSPAAPMLSTSTNSGVVTPTNGVFSSTSATARRSSSPPAARS
jgi:hypothetical protein